MTHGKYSMAIAALLSSAITFAAENASATPLSAGAIELAARAGDQALTIPAATRRVVRSAPRVRIGPSVVRRSIVRAPRAIVRHPRYVRRRGVGTAVILGIGSGLYYDPYPYYYESPYEEDAIAYCIRRFRSYDIRTMMYLGYDGLLHPCP